MAIKSADQISIVDITDAYSVILSNESHTFVGGTTAAVAGSTTTNVYAFQGDTQVAVTIGEITEKTGITASVSNNGSTNALVTFTVTTALTSGGTIDIPVTITGTDVTITKKFTYGIAFKGATGSKGDTGATGKGVSKIETFYLTTSSSSGVTTSTSGWSTTPTATTTTNKYIWMYQKTTYTDNTTSSSTPAIVGTHGATGATGGTGATGKGVSKIETFYLTTSSSSGVTTSTSGWNTTPAATTTSKKYIWSYQKFTYTDGTTSTSTPAIVGTHGATGATGAAGADAISISITTDNGNIFKNSNGSTTMTAHVYKGGKELSSTEIAALGTLKWYKDGGTTAVTTGASHTVAASAITNKAVFTVQLEG